MAGLFIAELTASRKTGDYFLNKEDKNDGVVNATGTS